MRKVQKSNLQTTMKKIMFNDRYGLTEAVLTGRKTMTRRLMPEDIAKMVEAASKPTLLINSLPNDSDAEKFADEWKNHRGVVTYQKESDAQLRVSKQIKEGILAHAQYKVGDVVAIAQSYKSIYDEMEEKFGNAKANSWWCDVYERLGFDPTAKSGYRNKMFVSADLMPHQIKITDVRFERLRDISYEDCRREGIIHVEWKQWLEQDIHDLSPQRYKMHDLWTLPIFEEEWLDSFAEQSRDNITANSPQLCFTVLFAKLAKMQPSDMAKLNPWTFVYDFKLIK